MADVTRTLRIPNHLPAERFDRLQQALNALQARQHALANQAPGAVAASEVVLEPPALTLRYPVTGVSTLRACLGQIVPEERLQRWARMLGETLAAAYPVGQVPVLRHGGLSADGIVVLADGELRLLDFGVAECFAAALDAADDAWIVQIASTVAPERWSAPGSFGPQGDIFALGVLLYELATGRHPFGAQRDDPDDCKYQVMVEVPRPPTDYGLGISPGFSDFLMKTIRSDPRDRYESFAQLLDALDATTRAPLAPAASADDDTPVTDADLDDAARQRYLAEQAQLRQEREAAEQRRIEQRQRLTRVGGGLRRHLRLVLALATAVVALCAVLGVLAVRSAHHRAVRGEFEQLTAEMAAYLTSADSDALAGRVGWPAPDPALRHAVDELHHVAGGTGVRLRELYFDDVMRRRGTAQLELGSLPLTATFRLTAWLGRSIAVELDETAVTAAIRTTADELALARLGTEEKSLMQRIREAVDQSTTVADAERRIGGLMVSAPARPLGYLGFHGDDDSLRLGPVRPVPGQDAIRADAHLRRRDAAGVFPEPPALIFHYTCTAGACTITQVTLDPPEESEAHGAWCLTESITDLQQAFAAHDVDALTRLTRAQDRAAIEQTLQWTAACRDGGELVFRPSTRPRSAEAVITCVPEVLDATPIETLRPIVFAFDPTLGWRVHRDSRPAWPAAPTALQARRLGTELLVGFREAWTAHDAVAYLAWFPNTTRSAASITDMFTQFENDGATFDITAAAADTDRIAVTLTPTTDTAAPGGYRPKTFTFKLQDGALVWDGLGDPLWVFVERRVEAFAQRLRTAPWSDVPALSDEFDAMAESDFAPEERAAFRAWLDALIQAHRLFEPAGPETVAGFPVRATLRTRGDDLTFRLVFLAEGEPAVLYIQEREATVADIEPTWRDERRPWERWARAVGAPPDGQAVGLTRDEALAYAGGNGCTLPTAEEWRHAAAAFGDTPAAPSAAQFHGGVWEYCRTDGDADTVQLLGGCWQDYAADAEAPDAGHPRGASDTPQALLPAAGRFGTVGFRLAQRLQVPELAVPATLPGLPAGH